MIPGNAMRLGWLVAINALALWWLFDGQIVIGLALHFTVVTLLLWGTLNPQSGLFGPIQKKCDSQDIWFTFDDGPDPTDTPAILDLLKAHGVKATFFVIGEKAKQHPDLIRQIHAEGHQIGNHTWSHPQRTFWCAGPWRTYREIVRCQECIEEILGEAPKVFRAPVGHHNFFVHVVLRRFGLRLIGWSSRGFDGISQNADEVMDRIRQSMTPGGIVLAHEDSAIAADVTSAIIKHAEENGWSFMNPTE